jgi:NAD(P)-dependent dehydrogenase (short-subunit alcohol dehydrogenase family)
MTILITGANRGIGLALTTQLHQQGQRVIAVCRKSSPKLDALGIDVIDGIDVSHPASLKDRLSALEINHLDVLINNAGILKNEHLGELDYDQIRLQFEINTLGPLQVTESVLHLLSFGSKIINITSRMGSITDNSSGGRYGYRISKAALNMASMSLAQDLKEKGISVAVVHPGFVQTEMTGLNGLIGPEESAQGIIKQMEKLTLDESGSFWHSNGERLPW